MYLPLLFPRESEPLTIMLLGPDQDTPSPSIRLIEKPLLGTSISLLVPSESLTRNFVPDTLISATVLADLFCEDTFIYLGKILQQFTAFKPLAHRPKPMLAKP